MCKTIRIGPTLYKGTQPCNNCPYRKDAPLQLWSKKEFEELLKNEADQIGSIYLCHKDNGTVCRGWLINQDKNNFPSIALRLSLTKNNVTREYLDKLNSPATMFNTVSEMCYANYKDYEKQK